jgi:hypothetical protein
MHPAKPVSETSLGTRMILAVALSYVIDGLLLGGFAIAGTISPAVPLAYAMIGVLCCSAILLLRAWLLRVRGNNSEFALTQLVGSSLVQLVFTLAPSDPRLDTPRRVHSDRRGERPDFGNRRLGNS